MTPAYLHDTKIRIFTKKIRCYQVAGKTGVTMTLAMTMKMTPCFLMHVAVLYLSPFGFVCSPLGLVFVQTARSPFFIFRSVMKGSLTEVFARDGGQATLPTRARSNLELELSAACALCGWRQDGPKIAGRYIPKYPDVVWQFSASIMCPPIFLLESLSGPPWFDLLFFLSAA